jgi:hypothetical protein
VASGIAYETVHDSLREAVPEFESAIDEHIADNGEVLQHPLFGDLTRFVVAAHERGDDELVRRCLAFLELALLSDDDRLNNLVAVSFIENVGPYEKAMRRFIKSWPNGLREEAQRQRDWRTGAEPSPGRE